MEGVEGYLREEERAAERVAARVRLVVIVLLVLLQLVLLATGSERSDIVNFTLVVGAFTAGYGVVFWYLLRRFYHPALSYVGVALDIGVVTTVAIGSAAISAGGVGYAEATKSGFSLLYFVVIALAGQRQRTGLALFAGVLSAAAYLSLLIPVAVFAPSHFTSDLGRDFSGPDVSLVRVGIVAALLAVAGVVAAATAYRARRLVGRAVAERTAGLLEQQRRQLLLSVMERYFPEKEALQMIAGGQELKPGGERKQVTVLTTDIRGFTGISERLSPDAVVEFLNAYFEEMVEAVFQREGTLISFVGDGLWAVFGLPSARPEDADRALAAALDMRARLVALNGSGRLPGVPQLRIGMAIHSGEVLAGSIGSRRRLEYTVIGDTVNTTARLEEANKKLGTDLLVSEATVALLSQRDGLADRGRLELRGRQQELRIYAHEPAGARVESG